MNINTINSQQNNINFNYIYQDLKTNSPSYDPYDYMASMGSAANYMVWGQDNPYSANGSTNPFLFNADSAANNNRVASSASGNPRSGNLNFFGELKEIANDIGMGSLINIQFGDDGNPVGVFVEYSPKRVGQILIELARSGQGSGVVSKLRRMLSLLEGGRFIGLAIYTVDESGVPSRSGLVSSSSTVIGSTNQLIAPGTQGFNAFGRASEVLLAWLDILAFDPSSIPGSGMNIAGSQIPKEDIEAVNLVMKKNPEMPAELRQYQTTLKNYTDRQEQNISGAQGLRDVNKQLLALNGKSGGGGQG
jgi:hypothetical protein